MDDALDTNAASGALSGCRVVVPESRALDMFCDILARQGAQVIRCPLVSVQRLEDHSAVDAWIGRLVAGEHDSLLFYTGEGVDRIVERAGEISARDAVVEALARLPKLVRGPKPVAALRRLGAADNIVRSDPPTTDGLLAMIDRLDVRGTAIGVQLYPSAPEERLATTIRRRGAEYDPVLPYAYASDEADLAVEGVIRRMAAGEADWIAFTSQSQVQRLLDVAERRGIRPLLDQALGAVRIAAVGPITEQAVHEAGGEVHIRPEENFHMKPLVAEMARHMRAAT